MHTNTFEHAHAVCRTQTCIYAHDCIYIACTLLLTLCLWIVGSLSLLYLPLKLSRIRAYTHKHTQHIDETQRGSLCLCQHVCAWVFKYAHVSFSDSIISVGDTRKLIAKKTHTNVHTKLFSLSRTYTHLPINMHTLILSLNHQHMLMHSEKQLETRRQAKTRKREKERDRERELQSTILISKYK